MDFKDPERQIFKCTVCDKEFSRENLLKEHINIHANGKSENKGALLRNKKRFRHSEDM